MRRGVRARPGEFDGVEALQQALATGRNGAVDERFPTLRGL